MTSILITGGAGFIGSSLADALVRSGRYEVVLADNLLTGSILNVPQHKNCRYVHCDVNDFNSIAEVMRGQPFEFVFHYAAVVGVKRTLSQPLLVLGDLIGIKNVLDLSRETSVKRFFYSSSSEVYGEPVELPQHEETTPLNSRLPYAVVKNAGESFCRAYQQEYGLNYTIFRFFNTYGPKQSEDFVISKFLSAALENRPITIYGNGLQTRTFCYIDDNANCAMKIMEDDLMLNSVINIGNDEEITMLDLAQKIISITKSESAIEFLPALKEGDMTRRKPDISKMRRILNRPLKPLEVGLSETLTAFRQRYQTK